MDHDNEPWSKNRFIKWAKALVAPVTGVEPGKRYPALNYRLLEPEVRRFDPGAADILAKLQAGRLRELGLMVDLANHLKIRLDGK